MLERIQKLKGEEWTLLQLDNIMQEAGFLSELDGDVKTWFSDGCVVYTFIDDVEQDLQQVIITFEQVYQALESEPEFKTRIKVIEIEMFS